MNIKLSLLITLAALGYNINAQTIRERLIREHQIANEQIKRKTLELKPKLDGLKPYQKSDILKSQAIDAYSIVLRVELLEDMIMCMDQSTPETENIAANWCFTKLSNKINNLSQRYTNKEEREMIQKELGKIGQKDLRRSWFWWLQ